LKENFPSFAFDFKDLFFAVGVRVGSSETAHIDWGDNRRGGMAFVVTISEFDLGGEIVLPQLEIRVCPVIGDVVCFQAGRLLHEATTPHGGRRVVLTLFTCNGLYASTFGSLEKQKREKAQQKKAEGKGKYNA
jgi:hypothetical protein